MLPEEHSLSVLKLAASLGELEAVALVLLQYNW
jgi:hypothetical protein